MAALEKRSSVSKRSLSEQRSGPPPEVNLVPIQRARYYQLWQDVDSPFLTLQEQTDKDVEIRWLELSLGFVTPEEHRRSLAMYLDEIEANQNNNNEAKEAFDYITGNANTPKGVYIPRTIEIRNRVMTEDQLSEIRRRIRY